MNYLLWDLFGPATWPGWLAVSAVILHISHRRALAHAAVGMSATLFVLFGLSPLSFWLIHSLEDRYPIPELATAPANILVLTGGEHLYASERAGTLEVKGGGDRAMRGAELAHRYPGAHLWVAGNGGGPSKPASDTGMHRLWWERVGIAPTRITEIKGTPNTCANLAGYAQAKTNGTTLLVTSAAHMRRAILCGEKQGLPLVPYPVDFQTGEHSYWSGDIIGNLDRVQSAMKEYVGIALYRLQGRI